MIATWIMSYEALKQNSADLMQGASCEDVLERSINQIENYPYYKSVGYGGLPNEDGIVELDGAFMDGRTLSFGAVGGLRDIKNPVSVARLLTKEKFNNLIVGEGAKRYALAHGFETAEMLHERAKTHYEIRLREMKEKGLSAYAGHDTVGMVCMDQSGHMCVATSTSGLFMKKEGRVGDSPVMGCGFYCDEEIGGCVATGVGEEIMKGVISYEVVRLMDSGLTPQQAADKAVRELTLKLNARRHHAGAISVVCMDKDGRYGVGTNVDFSFVTIGDDGQVTVYEAKCNQGTTVFEEASEAFKNAYYQRITAKLEYK